MKSTFSNNLTWLSMLLGLQISFIGPQAATLDDLTYDASGETVTITDCNQRASGALEIPSMIEEKLVTTIKDFAFHECRRLTSVNIPNSITSIGSGAFRGCSSLTNVTLPESITAIESKTFYKCSSLTSVIIPHGVASVGDWAFLECSNLSSVIIPSSVTSIGDAVFSECASLEKITTTTANPSFSSVSGILYNKSQTLLHTYPAGKSNDSFTIPDSVTSIGNSAFYWGTNLIKITIPDSVTTIGDWAFGFCNSLRAITIPDSVTSIGFGAFVVCESLTSITIPESVTSIGDGAFGSCSALTSVTIPNSVTSIGDGLFGSCISLNSITIPTSVTSIGERAFLRCTSLTKITIPESVTSLELNAFTGCIRLANLIFQGDAPKLGRGFTHDPPRGTVITVQPNATGFDTTFGGLRVRIAESHSTISKVKIDSKGNFILKLDSSNKGIKLFYSPNLHSAFTEVSDVVTQGNNELSIKSTAAELQGIHGFFRISN